VSESPTPHRMVDLLASLNVSLESDVSYRPGPHSSTPSILFGSGGGATDGAVRNARLTAHQGLAGMLERTVRDFSILVSVKQKAGNVGTIFMITDGEDVESR
jgi:hypothetical protein